jgi:hypothetical protein
MNFIFITERINLVKAIHSKKKIFEKTNHPLINTMPLDFTLSKFRSLCSIIAQHYPTLTLAEYFEAVALPESFAMMRHDIDRKPTSALSTARIETESGIKHGE